METLTTIDKIYVHNLLGHIGELIDSYPIMNSTRMQGLIREHLHNTWLEVMEFRYANGL